MQISGKNTPTGLSAYLRVGKGQKSEDTRPAADTGAAAKNAADQDTVDLSSGLRGERVSGEPEVRMEKVMDVRERIADGRYEVSPDRVAVRMILDALADVE